MPLSIPVLKELEKLIKIAKQYRGSTISESMLYDVLFSLKLKDGDNQACKDFLYDNDVIIVSDNEDIEESNESIDETVNIKPYDASKIDITFKPMSLSLLIDRLIADEIDLMPDFQRQAGLWSPEQKSQLIESLILRIPLPAFYFDGSSSDYWIVIDGLQRLTAIKEFFVDKTLKLRGLEFLSDLVGASADDLPRAYERRIFETQVVVYIINPGAPENLKYNIFKRINTGGLKLEAQEIRHALYQGFATELLKCLANTTAFKRTTGYSVKTDRMLDREFVLRFIAFYELGDAAYKGSIDDFLNDAMLYLNKNGNENYKKDISELFGKVLNASEEIFGAFAFRKMPDYVKRRPISKALFETWTSALARLTDEDRSALIKKKKTLVQRYVEMCNLDKDFIDSLSSAKVYSVKKRNKDISDLIRSVLDV